MQFGDQGIPLSVKAMDQACDVLGVTPPVIWAVLTVEAHDFGFLADRRPRMRFQRDVFHQLTRGRFDAAAPDISSAVAGGSTSDAADYSRLEAAIALDHEAALESASWGIGQLLGFHYERAGFPIVLDFVAHLMHEEDEQLRATQSVILHSGLAPALQRGDWTAFAREYNGPGFRKPGYDTRLAAACVRYQQSLPDLGLRAAQAALLYLGLDPGPVDGIPGQRTHDALLTYQLREGLRQTGTLSAETEDTLLVAAFTS